MLLAQQTQRPEYTDAVRSFCDYTIDEQKRTPLGLVFIDKSGTLSHAANVAFICMQVETLHLLLPNEFITDFFGSRPLN